jgi:predicted AlkP superfamily pyrophosphatase or phosphodiesterase
MTRKKLIAILFDALRHDFITRKNTPFLYQLRKEGTSGSLNSLIGFQPSGAWFEGLYPDESNKFCVYWRRDDINELKPFSFIPEFLDNLPRIGSHIRWRIKNYYRNRTNNNFTKNTFTTARIPFRMIKKFEMSEKYPRWKRNRVNLQHKNLFDYLEDSKKKFFYFGYPTNNCKLTSLKNYIDQVLEGEFNFIYLHIGDLDWESHREGLNFFKLTPVMREIDSFIKKIYCNVINKNSCSLVIFGDHGVVPVNNVVDIYNDLLKEGIINRKSILFIDSVLARFWPESEHEFARILNTLSRKNYGRIINLTEELRELYHVNFSHDHYGSIIFLANEGTFFFPNFFSKKPDKGTHGYGHLISNNNPAYVTVGEDIPPDKEINGNLVDLFPTFCDLLSLPAENRSGKILW